MADDYSYYDWQVSTLMLAYDLVDPIPRGDMERLTERQQLVQQELSDMVHETLPEDYLKNPTADFPPEIVAILTRATLKRALKIGGV